MKHKISAEYKHVRLRPLNEGDLEKLRTWRNDPQLSIFLRKIGMITQEMQMNWFKKDCEDNTTVTFAIEEIGELNRIVGSVSLYDINENTAEVGKIVVGDLEARGKKVGYYALLLAMYVGCERFGLESYLCEVNEDNKPSFINKTKAGFTVIGRRPDVCGGYEVVMKLSKEHFFDTHDFLDEIVISED